MPHAKQLAPAIVEELKEIFRRDPALSAALADFLAAEEANDSYVREGVVDNYGPDAPRKVRESAIEAIWRLKPKSQPPQLKRLEELEKALIRERAREQKLDASQEFFKRIIEGVLLDSAVVRDRIDVLAEQALKGSLGALLDGELRKRDAALLEHAVNQSATNTVAAVDAALGSDHNGEWQRALRSLITELKKY